VAPAKGREQGMWKRYRVTGLLGDP
jgi:hypothetical protein